MKQILKRKLTKTQAQLTLGGVLAIALYAFDATFGFGTIGAALGGQAIAFAIFAGP